MKRMLGSGHQAKVYLAENKLNNQLYAIKAIDKCMVTTKTQTRHAHDEKDVLMMLHHPFLMKLWGSFQTSQYLCLVTEHVSGGELSSLLKREKLSEDHAKFFAAEIVVALEYLHSLDIIYRDLKPENIMLDSTGHVKLIDFGFSKILKEDNVTFTLCGTPDYLAPEIIRARGYTHQVDWWSLGVLIYEMIVGFTPFNAETPIELYENILLCDINWLCHLSPDAKDLIQGLLQSKPKDRLDLNSIKSHPWFSAIDFNSLSTSTAPFIPKEPDTTHDNSTQQLFLNIDDRFSSF